MGSSTQGAPLTPTTYLLPRAGVEKSEWEEGYVVGRGGRQTYVVVEQEIHKSDAIRPRGRRVNIFLPPSTL